MDARYEAIKDTFEKTGQLSEGQIKELLDEVQSMSDNVIRPFGCYDCGLVYGGEGWMDVTVPDEVWHQISPTHDEGGILCITCIARRCERLLLENVPVKIQSGPLVNGYVTGIRPIRLSIYKDRDEWGNDG